MGKLSKLKLQREKIQTTSRKIPIEKLKTRKSNKTSPSKINIEKTKVIEKTFIGLTLNYTKFV